MNMLHWCMATLGTLVTSTTYGTWLRGDQRGWVDQGILWPEDPLLELADYQRLKHEPFRFAKDQLFLVGEMICSQLWQRMQIRLLALTVRTWHIHVVLPATTINIAKLMKCVKESVRFGLKIARPIWTDGYDQRFCFDWERLHDRVYYVEQHNIRAGWPAQPWPKLMPWEEYVQQST
ncbi:MAG: hypothetical protein JNJ77_09460 [Planctomycetia bacterium]|nr:hypothetical protein [Planctomycetia bacterium]